MNRLFISLVLLCIISCHAFGQQDTLQQCQRYKDQADRYQELRRQGGRGPEMDEWKKQMRKYEQRFRDGECHKYRNQLRN